MLAVIEKVEISTVQQNTSLHSVLINGRKMLRLSMEFKKGFTKRRKIIHNKETKIVLIKT